MLFNFNRRGSWTSTNLVYLNCGKTVFLITGLTKQLPKIYNSSLNTTHFARKPNWLYFDPFLLSPIIFSPLSKSLHSHMKTTCT